MADRKDEQAAPTFAQYGDEGRCSDCGLLVELREVWPGPQGRWVALRRTTRSRQPHRCRGAADGMHRTATHDHRGAPRTMPGGGDSNG